MGFSPHRAWAMRATLAALSSPARDNNIVVTTTIGLM